MRLGTRSILAVTAIVVLQMAICPAVCIAGTPDRPLESAGYAAADPEPTPANAMPPCHQGQRETPAEAPRDGDRPAACISCSAETPLTHAAETVAHAPTLSLIAFFATIDPAPEGAFSRPCECDRDPPPTPLYLLKNSFLL